MVNVMVFSSPVDVGVGITDGVGLTVGAVVPRAAPRVDAGATVSSAG
jgi:hypothetical protein